MGASVFLVILSAIIVVLTHKAFLRPSPVRCPYHCVSCTSWRERARLTLCCLALPLSVASSAPLLQPARPTLSIISTRSKTASLHYLHLALLPVAVVTLLLFFASGMYSERIGYANRYVLSLPLWACCAPHPPQPNQPFETDPTSSFPQRISYVPHANRALRSMNMHLNMRTVSSPWKRLVPFPFSLIFPASSPTPQRTRTSTTTGAPIPLPSIPPTKNPRGELIFSSRVDRPFKDGYERYRALFEKRRAERYHQLRASQTGLRGLWWRLLGYKRKKVDATTTGSDAAGGRTSQRSSRTPSPSPSAVLAGATAAGAVGAVELGSSIGTPPLSTPKSMDAPVNP